MVACLFYWLFQIDCCSGCSLWKCFCETERKILQHEAVNVRKGIVTKKGIYHIQNVNRYHTRLKKWMNRFQGVATKYLDNYLFWHRFLELNKKIPKREQVKEMLLVSCQRVNFTTVEEIKRSE